MATKRKKVRLLEAQKIELVGKFFKQTVPDGIIVRPNLRTIVHNHTYGGLSPFYAGLTKGKLMGTLCDDPSCVETGIWLAPRVDCPDCWGKMRWVEIDTVGAKVYTHSTTNYPGAGFKMTVPCPLISVEIPGVCTKFMSYLFEFGEGEPCIGMPIRPKFRRRNPTYSILDLSWIPVDNS